MTVKAAFVFEQTLGHVTHSQNLRQVAAGFGGVSATWLPIEFDQPTRLRRLPVIGENWSLRSSWLAHRSLQAMLRVQAPDVLFFHTQVTALLSTRLMRRIPTVISLDATPINFDSVGRHYGHIPAQGSLLDRGKHFWSKSVFQQARGLIAWSDWARQSLVHDYGIEQSKIQVIAPGAAAPFFDIGQRRHSMTTTKSHEQRGKVQLLFVGGDLDRKGGSRLIELMRGPLSAMCELDIVTAQPLRSMPAGVRVHPGLGPNTPELQQLFENADLFVLPSRGECLAVVLMEATAAGLPVITTDVGALAEAVVPGESGLLVPVDNAGALTSAITALATDPDRRRAMGRAGHALARRKFDSHRNGQAVLRLIAELGTHREFVRRAA